ncbi:MAG: hypothetical protein E7536_04615 [Ruminococcaceae bacterium]|nr:hypothetical protein [Oscillospiraceae bacterium]
MVTLIIGHKGSGKTKKLIQAVNDAIESSNGNVVCIEQGTQLRTEVNYRARLVSANEYSIKGFDSFYGFLSGICAGDHDITDILIDATLRIGSRDYAELAIFLKKVEELAALTNKKFVFTVSADKEELPAEIFDYCKEA